MAEDVFIVGGARTPMASYVGALKDVSAIELGAVASRGALARSGVKPGWVDHVVTPVGAFGFIVAEDALDRYFVKWTEGRVHNRFYRIVLRLAFNPGRTFANAASGRAPWHRDGRSLN